MSSEKTATLTDLAAAATDALTADSGVSSDSDGVSISPTVCLDKPYVHSYSSRLNRPLRLADATSHDTYFNVKRFFNQNMFTINYNEEHLLLVKSKCYRQPDCSFFSADLSAEGYLHPAATGDYLCMSVYLRKPDVAIYVAADTTMDLLLSTQKLHVIQYIVNASTAFRLMQMEIAQMDDSEAMTTTTALAEKCSTKISLYSDTASRYTRVTPEKRKRIHETTMENARILEEREESIDAMLEDLL
jgi:hypothetical protein